MTALKAHQVHARGFLCARVAVWLIGLTVSAGTSRGDPFAGGTGAPNDPYQIATARQLLAVGEDPPLRVKHFLLTADIDLSGTMLSAPVIPTFSGTFDGNGRCIRNLAMRSEDLPTGAALFGIVASDAVVKDLGVEDVNLVSEGTVSALAFSNLGHILNCHSSGSIRGGSLVAGLVAINRGRMTDCHSAATVREFAYAASAGGLVASNDGTLTGCYSSGTVSGGVRSAGGLVEHNSGVVMACYSTADVTGGTYAGGLVGGNTGLVALCYSAGTVQALPGGGFVGDNAGAVINCYSTSAIAGGSNCGGFAASNSGGLTHCYAAGPIRSWSGGPAEHVNGFVGRNDGEVTGCFWDTEKSGCPSDSAATGLPTATMMNVETYLAAAWDFNRPSDNGPADFWEMPEAGGYPLLNAFGAPVPPTFAGRGTPRNPYLLSTAADLCRIWRYPEASYKLVAPLDMAGITWYGPVIPAFSGTLDGNDLTIRHLTVRGGSYLGLFGMVNSAARIHDLGIEDANIVGRDYLGGLAGRAYGTVLNCCTGGMVRGHDKVGGLIGYLTAGTSINCASQAAVTGNREVGGLIGTGYGVVLIASYSCGPVGGKTPSITDLRTGETKVTVGGLVGSSEETISVRQCFWDVNTSGQTASAVGEGLSTPAMTDMSTYLAAGWDFTGEAANGLSETWSMPETGGYPVLSVLHGYRPPVLPGRGTPEDPFIVSTPAELAAVCYAPEASYKLGAAIDFSSTRWRLAPIPFFSGTFDGNGLKILHLTIDGDLDLGLFGQLDKTAVVGNLTLQDVNVVGLADVGSLAGENEGNVTACSATDATMHGVLYVGGLAGFNTGSITDSHSSGAMQGARNVGGLVGYNKGDLVLCASQGDVEGDKNVGGLVGYTFMGTVAQCASSAMVTAPTQVGGLIGYNYMGAVRECYSDGAVSGGDYALGGLIGANYGGTVMDSYSKASVRGASDVAGLVGANNGVLRRCYSCGPLQGQFPVGGITTDWGGDVIDCFWDRQATGADWSAGGTGLSTSAMKDFFTFLLAGWDFVGESGNGTEDTWIGIINDYPQLRWQHGR